MLTHSFPMNPFSTPLKIPENRKVFWCFKGVEKGCTGNEWVKDEGSTSIKITFIEKGRIVHKDKKITETMTKNFINNKNVVSKYTQNVYINDIDLFKGTLMKIWKSPYMFVFIWGWYLEKFAFLILGIIELFSRKVCEMFVYKHTETIEYVKN